MLATFVEQSQIGENAAVTRVPSTGLRSSFSRSVTRKAAAVARRRATAIAPGPYRLSSAGGGAVRASVASLLSARA